MFILASGHHGKYTEAESSFFLVEMVSTDLCLQLSNSTPSSTIATSTSGRPQVEGLATHAISHLVPSNRQINVITAPWILFGIIDTLVAGEF